MIASGVFMLPATLATYGSVSLVGWVISGLGAMSLAVVYAWLAQIKPDATGGPYAYTREGMGDFAAFLVAWGYWISVWATNAAIAVASGSNCCSKKLRCTSGVSAFWTCSQAASIMRL